MQQALGWCLNTGTKPSCTSSGACPLSLPKQGWGGGWDGNSPTSQQQLKHSSPPPPHHHQRRKPPSLLYIPGSPVLSPPPTPDSGSCSSALRRDSSITKQRGKTQGTCTDEAAAKSPSRVTRPIVVQLTVLPALQAGTNSAAEQQALAPSPLRAGMKGTLFGVLWASLDPSSLTGPHGSSCKVQSCMQSTKDLKESSQKD